MGKASLNLLEPVAGKVIGIDPAERGKAEGSTFVSL